MKTVESILRTSCPFNTSQTKFNYAASLNMKTSFYSLSVFVQASLKRNGRILRGYALQPLGLVANDKKPFNLDKTSGFSDVIYTINHDVTPSPLSMDP